MNKFLHQLWTDKKNMQVELQIQRKLSMFKPDCDVFGIIIRDVFIITNQSRTGYILRPSMLSNKAFLQDG